MNLARPLKPLRALLSLGLAMLLSQSVFETSASAETYAEWIATFSGLRTADQDSTADPDGDGRDNATEFADGTNPLVRDLPDGSLVATTDWHVALTGDDTNAGTLAAPFRTVARAIQSALPGDHVLLHAGVYRETVTPTRSGTSQAPIIIEPYQGEDVVISATEAFTGPWTFTSNGIYTASTPGQLPVSFWAASGINANGTGCIENGGKLQTTVVNETSFSTANLKSAAPHNSWDFFSAPVTWKVRGLNITSTGSTPLPLANTVVYLSVSTSSSGGYAADDAITVQYKGNGALVLQFKKNTPNNWGTQIKSLTDATINGYDLTLGPETAGNVAYTFTIKRSGGSDVVYTGSLALSQSDWSDGGTGDSSYLVITAQESVTTTDLTQKYQFTAGSYEIWKDTGPVLLDEFDDGDLSTVNFYPAGRNIDLTSGYDLIFVDGEMQNEARFPNKTSTDSLTPQGASLTMNNTYGFTSATFNGKPDDFFARARFLGGVGQRWAWQCSTVVSSTGNFVQLDSSKASTWWWPNYANASSNPGTGYVFGTLNLLDADREWYLQRHADSADTLFLRMDGGADPSGHLVEMKARNWCVNIQSLDYITVRGLKLRAGAVLLNGNGLTLENCEARYLSHYLTFSNGSSSNGGVSYGGGVVVSGLGNTVKGCTLYDTAGSGIMSSGYNHLFTRNHIYNTDYSGTYAAGLVMNCNSSTASFNSIHDSGRDILRPTGAGQQVIYNDLYHPGRMAYDLGSTYTFGKDGLDTNGAPTRIGYNWVHDPGDLSATLIEGIYLDNYSRNYVVDHNVIWGFNSTAYSIRLNAPMFGEAVYHNTVIGCLNYDAGTWTPYPDSVPSADAGLWTSANHGMSYTAQNNLYIAPGVTPDTIIESLSQRDFRPKAGSAAIDPETATSTLDWSTTNGATGVPGSFKLSMAHKSQLFTYHEVKGEGVTIPGVNDHFVGTTPDNGAYERGGPVWKPGIDGWSIAQPRIQSSTATALGATRATARADVVSAGITATTVRLYWGTTDGGTNPASWENVVDLSTQTSGASLTYDLLNLTRGSQYFYRFDAVNADSEHWSDVQSFQTVASLTWDAGGSTDTSINLNGNWQDDAPPDLLTGVETAIFGTAGTTATLNIDSAFAALVFNRNANFTLTGNSQLSLGPGGISVTLPNTTARSHTINASSMVLTGNQTWGITNNTGTATLSVSSPISDGPNAFGITKTGSGTLNLSGDSSFDGDLAIEQGIVNISHDHALGSADGRTVIATTGTTSTGGQLRLNGVSVSEPFTITGTTEAGSFARAIANNSGSSTIAGDITLDTPSAIRLGADGGTLHVTGQIIRTEGNVATFQFYANTSTLFSMENSLDNNGGQIQITGGGTVVLNAAGNQIGTTVIFFSGSGNSTLRLGISDALNPNANLNIGSTSASANSDIGTFDLAGFDQTLNGLNGYASTGATVAPSVKRLITNSAPSTLSTLTVGNANATSTFDGVIADGTGALALTKVGTGTLILAAACNYSGPTTVTKGTLSLSAAGLSDTARVNLSTGATLNLDFSGTDTVGSLYIDGIRQRGGTWGATGSGATHTTSLITGSGLLEVTAGPYDAWIESFAALSAPDRELNADPDEDGRSNLEEYIAGTDPNTPDEAPRLGVARSAEGILVMFNAHGVDGTGYTGMARWFDLLCTTNLLDGPWLGVPGRTNILGTDQDITHTNSPNSENSYYRLQIRLKPAE